MWCVFVCANSNVSDHIRLERSILKGSAGSRGEVCENPAAHNGVSHPIRFVQLRTFVVSHELDFKMDIWSNELTLEFLRLYEGEPALWNKTCPEHRNQYHVVESWMRIKNKLRDGSIPVKELKKKRDNLMSVYRKQRARVLESMENGPGEIHKPDWLFYNVMSSFMDAVYNPRKSKTADVSITYLLC